MATFVNLTPHSITFYREGGIPKTVTVEPCGTIARVSVESKHVSTVDGIPIMKNVYGEVTGLPEMKSGYYYIVSSIVAQRVPERSDVFITNDAVRDENGRIIGCKSLAHV